MSDLVDGYPEDMRGEIDKLRADNERLRGENAKMVTAFREIDWRSKCDLAAEIAQRFIPEPKP